ncbi:MAG: hypothetical protein M1819_005512 [Sarea resinae]|nr:MAG: hypothetical protein M1819_005512 [Sarea resinae]
MKYELGDHSVVRCPENGLIADIEFKTKGYFSGTYNAITGTIKNEQNGKVLYELSGMWNGEMFIKNTITGHRELLFNATHAKHTPPIVRPVEEQDDRESRKLWAKVVAALKERNHEVATDEKTKIEDMQRDEAAARADENLDWHPRLFRPVRGGPGGPEEGEEDLDWILNANIDGPTPEAQTQQILAVEPIIQGQTRNKKFGIPPRSTHGDAGRSQTAPAAKEDAGNLIDFSDDNQAPAPGQTKQAPAGKYSAGAPPGLQQPLIPTSSGPGHETLVRQDTQTSELDEFVDAQEAK